MENFKKEAVMEIIRLAEDYRLSQKDLSSNIPGIVDNEKLKDRVIEFLYKKDPKYNALIDRLKQLTDEQIAELKALMWLGRGAGGEEAKDWPQLVERAQSLHMDDSEAYIAGKAPLAEYLREGMRKLGLQ